MGLLITKQLGTISVPVWQIVLQKIYGKVAPLSSPFTTETISSEAFYGLFIGFAWLIYFFASFAFLRGESQLLKNEENKSTAEEEEPIVSNGTTSSIETTTTIIPEYV